MTYDRFIQITNELYFSYTKSYIPTHPWLEPRWIIGAGIFDELKKEFILKNWTYDINSNLKIDKYMGWPVEISNEDRTAIRLVVEVVTPLYVKGEEDEPADY